MMDDAKTGIVNCIIVKDLSRFGRDHIDVDNYLERIFPLMDVRFISVMQNLDSYKNPLKMNSIEIPFLNLINEEYSRDISRKTKASLNAKRRRGQYVYSFTPYGYLKDPKDKNKLIVDENAASYINSIFDWYINGLSYNMITKRLNNLGILSPLAYKVSIGVRKIQKNSDVNEYKLWKTQAVGKILNNPRYTGDMVQGKTASRSYKIKERVTLPKEKWIIVKNTHEAIISHDIFEAAQELIQKHSKPKRKTVPSILARYIKCADCGKSMVRSTSKKNGIQYKKYVCSSSKKYGKDFCATHIISEDVLLEIILACIQKQISCVIDLDKVINNINQNDVCKKEIDFLNNKFDKNEREMSNINNLIQGLYGDYKDGLLTKDEYVYMKENYNNKNVDLLSKKTILINTINDFQIIHNSKAEYKNNPFISSYIKYKNITEVTRDIVVALIDEILVYEGRHIRINFKYQSEYEKIITIFA